MTALDGAELRPTGRRNRFVLDSEISGLDNLHAFLKHGNYVTRFSFPVLDMPPSKPKFLERLKDDFIVRKPITEQPEVTEKKRPHW